MPSKKDADFSTAVLEAKLAHMALDISEIKVLLRGEYVRHDEFRPVKQVVFGLVGAILVTVIGAVVTLVLKK